MDYVLPEKVGIKSEDIKEYIEILEKNNLATHDVIIARGNNICFEAYWKPFDENFSHRQYSVTKSFVAIAVGFLLQDGLIDIDKTVVDYFPKETENIKDEFMCKMTIREMMTMTTVGLGENHFINKPTDRVQHFFAKRTNRPHPAGIYYCYDSEASFVVGALVERISKMSLGDYLYKKLFKHIEIKKDDYEFLTCPGGHTWSDSALIMRPRAMVNVARFMLNYGTWNGKRLLNEEYLKTATSKLVDNGDMGDEQYNTLGYGYYIWRTLENSFFFNGMGCQFAICVPHKDIILIYNGDNQGKDYAKKVIIDNFFNCIVDRAVDTELPLSDKNELNELKNSLILAYAKGEKYSPKVKEINKRQYILENNRMGIRNITFDFSENSEKMYYENEQGKKEIPFGMCENVFFDFPQSGYSYETSSTPGNHLYRSAASAAWLSENKLLIKVQAIDKYFGILNMVFCFKDNIIYVKMIKVAEDFFNEYSGDAIGQIE